MDDYEKFVRTRTPALLRSAYLLTGDQHLAEDLVQEALARTHRAWRTLHDPGNAEAYARRVMYHVQVSAWRRRRVPESLPGDLSQVTHPDRDRAADHADATSIRVALEQALNQLSPRQRAVIVLRYFDDLTEAETADILGVTVGTVKTQAFRAFERLRTASPELGELLAMDGVGP